MLESLASNAVAHDATIVAQDVEAVLTLLEVAREVTSGGFVRKGVAFGFSSLCGILSSGAGCVCATLRRSSSTTTNGIAEDSADVTALALSDDLDVVTCVACQICC